jgi:hypothetical protein
MEPKNYVTASEIGEYVYCQRAWWLKATGKAEQTLSMLQGTLDHDALANLLSAIKRNMTIAWTVMLIGIGILLLVLSYVLTKG